MVRIRSAKAALNAWMKLEKAVPMPVAKKLPSGNEVPTNSVGSLKASQHRRQNLARIGGTKAQFDSWGDSLCICDSSSRQRQRSRLNRQRRE